MQKMRGELMDPQLKLHNHARLAEAREHVVRPDECGCVSLNNREGERESGGGIGGGRGGCEGRVLVGLRDGGEGE